MRIRRRVVSALHARAWYHASAFSEHIEASVMLGPDTARHTAAAAGHISALMAFARLAHLIDPKPSTP